MVKTRTNQPVEGIIEDVNEGIRTGEIDTSQTQWEVNLTADDFNLSSEDLSIEPIYCNVRVSNGKLIVVLVTKINNNSASAISPNIYTKDIDLPEEYSSKVYDYNNKPLNESGIRANILLAVGCTTNQDYGGNIQTGTCSMLSRSDKPNVFALFIPTRSIPANSSIYSDVRFFLEL